MQPSRRAFLFGRGKTSITPWTQFCLRLRRSCRGRVDEMRGGARLTPAGVADVLHARTLCTQYGVRLALVGADTDADAGTDSVQSETPLLWLVPTALNRLEPLAGSPGLWRAEAGVPVQALHAVGLRQFAHAPPGMTLASWLACEAGKQCATGCTAHAGVLGADVMLADGTRTALGPFGERDVQPLRSAVVQRLVPQLFELAGSDDAQTCFAHPHWPARARLDALRPRQGSVNLAQLLLGHAGTLAWVEAVVLATPCAGPGALYLTPPTPAGTRLDAAVKSLFDPDGLFASISITAG